MWLKKYPSSLSGQATTLLKRSCAVVVIVVVFSFVKKQGERERERVKKKKGCYSKIEVEEKQLDL